WGRLPGAFVPLKPPPRRACQHGRTGGETAGLTFWGEPQGGEGVLEDRPQLITPTVGMRLTHLTLQRVHRLQGRGFLRDQNKQEFVFKAWPPPFGAAACTALPEFACTCARARIQVFGGSLKRWQELLTFCQRYAGCCSKVAWSVFQLVIAQHHTEYTLFPIRSIFYKFMAYLKEQLSITALTIWKETQVMRLSRNLGQGLHRLLKASSILLATI